MSDELSEEAQILDLMEEIEQEIRGTPEWDRSRQQVRALIAIDRIWEAKKHRDPVRLGPDIRMFLKAFVEMCDDEV